MSAWLSPLCGRASGWLSILTTSAGRPANAGSVISRPVNGMTGSAGIVVEVVVDAAMVVDELVVVDVVDAGRVAGTVDAVVTVVNSVESLLPPLLHAVTA